MDIEIVELLSENNSELSNKFKITYEKKTDKIFEEYIKSIEENINIELDKYKDSPVSYKKDLQKKVNTIKTAWNRPLNIENLKKKQFDLFKVAEKAGEDILKELFGVIEYKELDCKTNELLKNWKKNTESYLTDYPLFRYKGKKGIEDSFFKDILRFLLRKYEYSLEKNSLSRANYLKVDKNIVSNMRFINNIPEEVTCREKISKGNEIKYKDDKILMGVNKNVEAETIVDSEMLDFLFGEKAKNINDTQNVLESASKKILMFNKNHRKLLQYVVSRREEIYKKTEIIESVNFLTTEILGLESSGANRQKVKNLLMGIAKTHYKVNKQGVGSFFDIDFIKNNNDKEFAVIYLSGILSNAIKKNDFINFHKNTFNALSDEAQSILLEFQEDRINRISNKNPVLTRILHIDEFEYLFRFTSVRSRRGRVKLVADALKELESQQAVVSKVNQINEKLFEITYLEFSTENKSKILSDKFEIGNLIE